MVIFSKRMRIREDESKSQGFFGNFIFELYESESV
jgi:hypothetical protein